MLTHSTGTVSSKPPLSRSHYVILAIHVAVAVGFTILGLVGQTATDGWSDLVNVVVGLLAGTYVVAVASSAVIARYSVESKLVRTLVVLLGPPLAMLILIVAIRAA